MCGIFGYLGSQSSRFNLDKFNMLGWFNDKRGGDSVGFYAKTVEQEYIHKGVSGQKLWKDFMVDKAELLNGMRFENPNVVLGHCRKASVGAITIAQAQPVEVLDAEGKVVMVGIHNGTLLNYKELAEKYKFEYPKEWTDSQIFINLIYLHGFDLLKEYNGAGAFVFYFPDSKDVYMFKGHSKNYNTANSVLSEERPLFMLTINDFHYFSSMKDSLVAINSNFMFIESDKPENKHQLEAKADVGIVDLEHNTLYHYNEGELKSKTPFDRSEMYQLNSSYNNTHYGSDYNDDTYIYGGANSHVRTRRSTNSNHNNNNNYNTKNIITSLFGSKISEEDKNKVQMYDVKNNRIVNDTAMNPNCMRIHEGFLREMNKGNMVICDGMYVFNRTSGHIVTKLMKPELMIDNINITTLFSYNGVIVKDLNHYVALHSLQSLCYTYLGIDRELFSNEVVPFSDYPLYDTDSGLVIGVDKETNGWALYNGIFGNIIDAYNQIYFIEDGIVKSYCYDYSNVFKMKGKNLNHKIDLIKNTKYFKDMSLKSTNYLTFIKNLIRENAQLLYSAIVIQGASETDIDSEIITTIEGIERLNNK